MQRSTQENPGLEAVGSFEVGTQRNQFRKLGHSDRFISVSNYVKEKGENEKKIKSFLVLVSF